jgi:phage terminase small subunit
MPVLHNAKHEAFARALAQGMSIDGAYAKAGYKPHRQNASRLMTNDGVRARVEELKAKVAEKAEWSAAERLSMLMRIAAANEEKDPRVAVSAAAEGNKMTGSYAPVKQEIDLRTSYTDLSDDELVNTISKLMQRAGQK